MYPHSLPPPTAPGLEDDLRALYLRRSVLDDLIRRLEEYACIQPPERQAVPIGVRRRAVS